MNYNKKIIGDKSDKDLSEFDRLKQKSSSMTAEQQIQFQLKNGKKKNPLSEIVGKWPGNETDEEFEKMLKELD